MRAKRYDILSNQIVEKFTIKEIFRDNWDKFVDEVTARGKQ